MSNLEAATESTQSLKKKKSWFGSLRDVVQKGAKAALGYPFKSEPHKDESDLPKSEVCVFDELELMALFINAFYSGTVPAEFKPTIPENSDTNREDSTQRQSIDSMTNSLTFSVRGEPQRRHRLLTKAATASLRQHLSHPSRTNRSSVYSVAERPSSEMAIRPTMDQFVTLSPGNRDGATHTRRSSVADSIVGSIRGIGRRVGKAKQTRSDLKQVSPEMSPETVPLPSSPIDIPAAAPILDLDLGTGGFMTPMFGRSPERPRVSPSLDSKKLMGADCITTGVPPPTPVLGLYSPPIKIADASVGRPVTPRDLLRITIKEKQPPGLPPGPQTPMPGTNMTLDLDATNSEKSDKSHVFERSFTPAFDKESNELRKMRSLDAMAEACAIAHANDELSQIGEDTHTSRSDSGIVMHDEQNQRPLSARRDNGFSETSQTLCSYFSDLPPLERQRTPDNAHSVATITSDYILDDGADSVDEDPFDDTNAVLSGPPSPDRSVDLPFRLKEQRAITGTSTTSAKDTEPTDSLEHVSKDRDSTAELTISIEEYTSSELHLNVITKQPSKENIDPFQDHASGNGADEEIMDPFQDTASDDDTNARAQQLVASDIILPNSDQINPAASEGAFPPAALTVPLQARLPKDQDESSPRNYRSIYTTGLRDTEYTFSFDNWLKETSNAALPESQPSTPHRRRMETSLDSVSTDYDRKTPEVSPSTTTNFDGTPTMRGRKDFNLKRSDRNARVGAMQQPRQLVLPSMYPSSRRGHPRFIVGASDETDATGIQLANFENAYGCGSRETTPKNKSKPLQTRVGSEDSVADSIKNAALNYSQLEERLADAPTGDAEVVFADPTGAFDGAELPSEGFAIYENPIDFKSTSDAKRNPALGRAFGRASASVDDSSAHFKFKPATEPVCRGPEQSSPLPLYSKSTYSPPDDSANTVTGRTNKTRVTSADTLDRSLKLFMSSESGYQADESSVLQENSSASKPTRARYRTKRERDSGVLRETSSNSR